MNSWTDCTVRPVLHIFNGDCAAEAWQKVNPAATHYLVWRENYLEGPLPAADTPRSEFARIRAEFLHTCAPQYAVVELMRFQIELEQTLAALTAEDTVMLWFDDCMFDMLLLARILFLLEHSPAELHGCCEHRALGTETEFFRTPVEKFPKLSPEIVTLYADLWRIVISGGAALAAFADSGRLAQFPALERTFQRYLADRPQDGSLGLSERKLLALIADGNHDFMPLFRAFNASEESPFMGDGMCERMLQTLVAKGFLRCHNRRYGVTDCNIPPETAQ